MDEMMSYLLMGLFGGPAVILVATYIKKGVWLYNPWSGNGSKPTTNKFRKSGIKGRSRIR